MGGRGPPRGAPRLPPPPGAAVTYEMLQNMLDAQTARMEEASGLRTRTATVSAQIADHQNISGRHLRDASGGQMRVLGVCDAKMHVHRDLATSVKLLVFEHLAADLGPTSKITRRIRW